MEILLSWTQILQYLQKCFAWLTLRAGVNQNDA